MKNKWVKMLAILAIFCTISIYLYEQLSPQNKLHLQYTSNLSIPTEFIYSSLSDTQKIQSWFPLPSYFNVEETLFFTPYEGENSALRFINEQAEELDVLIQKVIPNKQIEYRILLPNTPTPIILKGRLRAKNSKETILQWAADAELQNFLEKENIFRNEDDFAQGFSQVNQKIIALYKSQQRRDALVGNIRFDTILVEKIPTIRTISLVFSEKNSLENALKSLQTNSEKIKNHLVFDGQLSTEQIGYTIFTIAQDFQNFQTKESKNLRVGVQHFSTFKPSDASFKSTTEHAEKAFVAYYKGAMQQLPNAIKKLKEYAETHTELGNEIHVLFIDEPKENNEFTAKIIAPIR